MRPLSTPPPTLTRVGQEHPTASHSICAECASWCCRREFPWGGIRLEQSDTADARLMRALEELGADVRYNDGAVQWRLHGDCPAFQEGKCTIYSIRPVACRGFLCFNAEFKDRWFNDSPLKNPLRNPALKGWRKLLARRGLAHDDRGWPSAKADAEALAAHRDHYDLSVEVVRGAHGRIHTRYSWRMADGLRRVTYDEARLPLELRDPARSMRSFRKSPSELGPPRAEREAHAVPITEDAYRTQTKNRKRTQ